jgi:hypothetical protein
MNYTAFRDRLSCVFFQRKARIRSYKHFHLAQNLSKTMRQIKAATLVLALLASAELSAQTEPGVLLKKAWGLMSSDRAAADSITYQLLELIFRTPEAKSDIFDCKD